MRANRVSEHAFLDAQAERVDRCEARGSDPCASKPAPAHCKLSCRNLWKVFGNEHEARALIEHGAPEERPLQLRTRRMVPAVCDVSFDVMTGEIFVIMGLSGSGKSTVMRCLSRLVEPTSGTIELDGQDLLRLSRRQLIELRRHRLGMVFQNFGLFPHLTVLENVAFPLRVQGIPKTDRDVQALRVIELVGLGGREWSYPHELSGGQQQRVGIARSLAVDPELWFLDEPFSALDPLIRRQMQDEFIRLQRLLKKTIVFITHDFLEAIRIADRVAIMNDGAIVQVGSPADLVLHPSSHYVAEFTRDVPLAKLLKVKDIAGPPVGSRNPSTRISIDTTLEIAIGHISNSPTPLEVVNAEGVVVGEVTASAVLRALAPRPAP